jgi:hypothetical protein
MSYHQIMGLGALECAKSINAGKGGVQCLKWGCSEANEVYQYSKMGPSCLKASGSSSVATAPAVTTVSAPATASASPATTKVSPGYTALAPKNLFNWSSYSKPSSAAAASSSGSRADAAVDAARREAGLNWFPWALGAAGVGVVLYLAKKRRS